MLANVCALWYIYTAYPETVRPGMTFFASRDFRKPVDRSRLLPECSSFERLV